MELTGNRKYEHMVYKRCTGTMRDFLVVFQRECIKLKPHKFYQHNCSERTLLSQMQNNASLTEGVFAIYADYAENAKKLSGLSGSAPQYSLT